MSSCVVITGGNGFLGKNVVAALKEQDCWSSIVPVCSADFDLRSLEETEDMFWTQKPDVVIHLAAVVGGIGANMAEPGRFAYENMLMGMNVLEAARNFGCKKLVLAGTICMYPKFCPVPFEERNIWTGFPEETNAPYGMAKKMLFVMADGYRKQYGLKSVCLMPVNLYGPGDNFDDKSSHVIPAMMKKFDDAKRNGLPSVELWGDGTPTREFLYVADCAEAFAIAAKDPASQEWINIGTGKEITIADLAAKIKKVVGYEGDIVWNKSKPNGQPRRCLDVRKSKALLGWEAKTDFDTGLQKMWEWYLHGSDRQQFTQQALRRS